VIRVIETSEDTLDTNNPPSLFPVKFPTIAPSYFPTYQPTYSKSPAYSSAPSTLKPSKVPVKSSPTSFPTRIPQTPEPIVQPTLSPIIASSSSPLLLPTNKPTNFPTPLPIPQPTSSPTPSPISQLTFKPTSSPTLLPTSQPTIAPTKSPTSSPISQTTIAPTNFPTPLPISQTTIAPTKVPTPSPISQTTIAPTKVPTPVPTSQPTIAPTSLPTPVPSAKPVQSSAPTSQPTTVPANHSKLNIVKLFRSVRETHDIKFNSSQDKVMALTQFEKNLNKIEHMNENIATGNLHFGVNQFSFDNITSFRNFYFGVVIPKKNPLQGSVVVHGRPKALLGLQPQATKTDWTGIYTTAIKNQGTCGCCYVFSAVSQIESDAIRLNHTSPLMQLSPQQPLDCGGPATALGCGGGFPLNIYAYVRRSGLVRKDLYPYAGGRNKQCKYFNSTAPVIVSVKKFYVFQSHTETDMAVYIQNVGPLAVIVYADKWQHYKRGIMTAAACGYSGKVNHAVQIVGVDLTVSNQSYWVVSTRLSCPLIDSHMYRPLIDCMLFQCRCGTNGRRVGEWGVTSDWSLGPTRAG